MAIAALNCLMHSSECGRRLRLICPSMLLERLYVNLYAWVADELFGVYGPASARRGDGEHVASDAHR